MLIDFKQILLTSCDDDLYVTNKVVNKNIISYDVLYQAGMLAYKVEIDLKEATVKKKEL
jgi:hypothetical protein